VTVDDPGILGIPSNPYHPLAWLVGEPEIGEGTWIGAFCVIDGSGGLRIGRSCDIAAGAHVYTHSTVRQAISENRAPIERRPTEIGDHVHIGANAVVLMGCTIGDHSVIGAGAVVREGTVAPPYSLLVGVPARVLEGAARSLAE
jgi:acetyltransferase-like isoleucine patch superfamily enzyme